MLHLLLLLDDKGLQLLLLLRQSGDLLLVSLLLFLDDLPVRRDLADQARDRLLALRDALALCLELFLDRHSLLVVVRRVSRRRRLVDRVGVHLSRRGRRLLTDRAARVVVLAASRHARSVIV